MDSETRRLALHAAVSSGSSKAVDAMLSMGLDFDGEKEINRDAIIRVASTHGLYAILEKLLSAFKDTDLDVQDGQQYGETPLIISARSGHMRTSSTLVAHGASLRIHDGYGIYPFVAAVRSGSLFLIRHAKLDLKGPEGRTALMEAVLEKHYAAAKLLIDAGADVNMEDVYGDKAFDMASKTKSEDMMLLIFETQTQPAAGTSRYPR
ncbi:ankyrin repeat-containing domain protein [Rhypophila decipiens]|uniref:Ankyrin repeat-containing domain protein n=1 Tax=Rhypophila decipiens TaxID=261697 RepID=A0AAN6XWU2_9PEZI|nr:ankyrin repeat-containing domain protein [Rhypophila decipiens]